MDGEGAEKEQNNARARIIQNQRPTNQGQTHQPEPPVLAIFLKALQAERVNRDPTNSKNVAGLIAIREKTEFGNVRPKWNALFREKTNNQQRRQNQAADRVSDPRYFSHGSPLFLSKEVICPCQNE